MDVPDAGALGEFGRAFGENDSCSKAAKNWPYSQAAMMLKSNNPVLSLIFYAPSFSDLSTNWGKYVGFRPVPSAQTSAKTTFLAGISL